MPRLTFPGPFDFELSLRLLCQPPRAAAHREWTPTPDHWERREYRRVVCWPGRPALLRLKSAGVVDRPELEWRLEGESGDWSEHVKRLVSAEVDLTACYASFRADAVLGPLSQQFYGLRVIRFPSLYECLLNTILEQQLNFWFAALVKRRLIEALGPAVEFEGRLYRGYPPPEALARLRPEDLRPLQISAPKARALIGVAHAAEELHPDRFAGAGLEAALERLMRLRGVGQWSSEYALLRGFGHPDALPAGDVGLQRSIRLLYGLRSPVTPLALRRRWRKLAPWRGYATYYVWLTQWE